MENWVRRYREDDDDGVGDESVKEMWERGQAEIKPNWGDAFRMLRASSGKSDYLSILPDSQEDGNGGLACTKMAAKQATLPSEAGA